ncbi:MAG: cyclic GMP-AMP synthase DncV-like nucleotidyltransferase [Lysobacteraceae bacterium]
MSVFDCSNDVRSFHDDEVKLSKSEQDEMRQRRDVGRRRLEIGLDVEEHPQPKMVHSQGSYSMWTMVQDDNCDYDIDDGVYFSKEDLVDDSGSDLAPKNARQRVCDALARDNRFEDPAEVHNNCVRQIYAAGYHIDMPVYRILVENKGKDDEKQTFELASGDKWMLSDARETTKWFRKKVSELNGQGGEDGNQMRRIVCMTKAFARSEEDWKEQTACGIVLTRLVFDELKSKPGRDDEALLETWKAINKRLAISTKVDHPVNEAPLAVDGDKKIKFFQGKLAGALKSLEVLEQNDCTRAEARDAWDSVFNTKYLGKLPDPSEPEGGKKALFVPTENKTDTRNDGNGRFGRNG